MSRHGRGRGQGTAWLVADQDNCHYVDYWYTGKSGDQLAEQARATTMTLAVGPAHIRTSQGPIRMPDHPTYWAGSAPSPPGIAATRVEDGRKTAKHVLREESP